MKRSRESSILLTEAAGLSPYVGHIVLLLAELVWLTVSVDTETLEHERSFWAQFIGVAPQQLLLIITAVTGSVLFAYRRLWRHVHDVLSQRMRASQAYGWLFVRALGYVILTPIAEELAFRGFLTRRLMRVAFQNVPLGTLSWLSFLVSSILFGALHVKLWLAGTVAVCVSL